MVTPGKELPVAGIPPPPLSCQRLSLQPYRAVDKVVQRWAESASLCSSCSLYSLRRWTQTCKVPSLTPCRLW